MYTEEFASLGKDFICFGDADNEIDVRSVVEKSKYLCQQWNKMEESNKIIQTRLVDTLKRIEILHTHLESENIFEKYNDLCLLEAEYKLTKLAGSLSALECYENISDIPQLVKELVQNAPKMLPSESKIFSMLNETSGIICTAISGQFNANFEALLVKCASVHDGKQLWADFLCDSSNQIVSYVLLNILPRILSNTGNIGECFEESVDSILSPMWSRFYFHLSTAREEKTLSQLQWTFDYCKGFTDTMTTIFAEITSDQYLRSLLNEARYNITNLAISEKIIRFMRAHVAEFMEILSPFEKNAILSIVESSIEVDEYIRMQCSDQIPSQYISEVICDYKSAFHIWVQEDQSYFLSRLYGSLQIHKNTAFAMRFKNSLYETYTSSASVSLPALSRSNGVNCFCSVYEVIWILVHICNRRYQFVPKPCQDIIMGEIIEPLMLSSIALLLFHIRTDNILKALSKGALPGIDGGHYESKTFLDSISEVVQSISYLNLSLQSLELLSGMQCDNLRFERRWRLMLPKLSASAMSDRMPVVLSPYDIVLNAFECLPTDVHSSKLLGSRGLLGAFDDKASFRDHNGQSSDVRSYRELREIIGYVKSESLLMCKGLNEYYSEF